MALSSAFLSDFQRLGGEMTAGILATVFFTPVLVCVAFFAFALRKALRSGKPHTYGKTVAAGVHPELRIKSINPSLPKQVPVPRVAQGAAIPPGKRAPASLPGERKQARSRQKRPVPELASQQSKQ